MALVTLIVYATSCIVVPIGLLLCFGSQGSGAKRSPELESVSIRADSTTKLVGQCRIGDSIESMRPRLKNAESVRFGETEGGTRRTINAKWSRGDHSVRCEFIRNALTYASEVIAVRDRHDRVTGRVVWVINVSDPQIPSSLTVCTEEMASESPPTAISRGVLP